MLSGVSSLTPGFLARSRPVPAASRRIASHRVVLDAMPEIKVPTSRPLVMVNSYLYRVFRAGFESEARCNAFSTGKSFCPMDKGELRWYLIEREYRDCLNTLTIACTNVHSTDKVFFRHRTRGSRSHRFHCNLTLDKHTFYSLISHKSNCPAFLSRYQIKCTRWCVDLSKSKFFQQTSQWRMVPTGA